ncbi:DUF4412 domain-containing protein [Rhodocytophaga rosea]|uniref:DUF4412 domain-containing protein n=1 Tax=Rhodocytophaga rosea TaxID=2704465 RepID=A0A6C0GTE9_9BACT|nr:DUF4412 domain-containing protein [Rhodocytophaga rosea]QHT71448.1 DUF4412 domain-containing protein [Rhodocytophaga rosea]
MKILSVKLFLLLVLIAGHAGAQNFEGTIKYSLKISLPEKQRSEMQQYAMMMPTGFEITTKNSLSKMKLLTTGGTMMELISEHTKKENFMLDHTNKKAYKLPEEPKSETAKSDSKPKVTKTSETETIAGYKCTKYIIEEPNSKSVQHIWTTKDIKIPVGAFSNSFGNKSGKMMMIDGVEGLPLKMIVTEHGTTSEVTATAVAKGKVNEEDLKVPSGYAVEPFDPAMIGRMMMGK